MTNRAASKSISRFGGNGGISEKTSLTKRDSNCSDFNQAENKTRTDLTIGTDQNVEAAKAFAAGLCIDRVWRDVVDFGEPTSGTGEEGWGRKRVSVTRVSILDGPRRQSEPPPDD
ncbi:MAG: hypothetical protein GY789_23970 [Hyphomicrobiales bacterium]|nr:hypothetical protein [Hyphomicrobiales bacterium]MCP5001460.1 hypothetical protein [Hyphomicrobiales bacterium]